MPTKKKVELPEEMTTPLEAQESQTEENITASPAEGAPDDTCDTSLSQTETDSAEADDPSAGIPDGALNEPTESQTEVKRPRRRKKTEQEPSQSDTEPETAPNAKEDGVDAAPKPKRKRTYTKPSVSVLSIDDRPTVETEADKAKNDLLDLIESQRSGRILTGTIQGVEQSADNPRHAFAVLYHGEFKVIIPAAEAVEPPEDYRGRDPDEVLHYMLTKRLGAEVDYIVKGIDPKSGIAAASRLEAMRARRKEMYFGTDRDGNNRIYAGICAEARVVSAIRAGIFIDLFGVESYIPLKELSYQRWMDAAAHFQPGQRILIKVLDVDRSDRDHVRVSASVKQAGENPYEKALRRYSVGNRYVGTVSMVDVNGVFVALDGGIDCLCSYPKRGRPPRGARVTVRILGINHETNRIWGAITHIAMPHSEKKGDSMLHCDLSQQEQHRRKEIAEHTRQMLLTELPIDSQDETSIMGKYRDYYLQISFSELHPLMVVCLAKALTHPGTAKQCRIANDLNLRSVLGSHAINDEVGCYSYRATHWLDTELDAKRFYEILDRCVDEADRGFYKLAC